MVARELAVQHERRALHFTVNTTYKIGPCKVNARGWVVEQGAHAEQCILLQPQEHLELHVSWEINDKVDQNIAQDLYTYICLQINEERKQNP